MSPTERPKNILVVDDEEPHRVMLERILRAIGYDTESAPSGDEALKKLTRYIDLVLTDVTMPVMDGFELVRRIRSGSPCQDVPVVMVTGMSSKSDRLRAVQCGANDFIAKPYERTEVEIRVRAQLMFKEMKDALKRHNDELEDIVLRRTGELQSAFQRATVAERETYEAHVDTISRLAAAAEYKDEDTGAHIVRIGRYCAVIARQLGLPDGEVELLKRASVLHDVGKIGIPDAVLLKPGRLTPDEFDVMRKHTEIGARILESSASELIEAGRVIAFTHHEKWNGTGYPCGLAGEEIPLWGRICAVADVFDALTSERPYKPAFSNEKALAIIKKDTGAHFDPGIVEVFLKNWEAILEIQREDRSVTRARNGIIAEVNLGSLLADAIERAASGREPGV